MRELLICLSFLLLPFSVSASPADPSAGLDSAVTAMADSGDGTGVWLTDWLKAHNARYQFDASIDGTSSRRIEADGAGKRAVILINESARGDGKAARYYAVLIAREAAEFVHLGMPESAEKRYMIDSCMAEVYFEMFGTRAELPLIGGVKDEEAAAQINAWVWDGPDGAPDAIARAGKYKKLSTLIEETNLAIAQAKQDGRDPAALERNLELLQKEQGYYDKEFNQREKYWWTLYQPQ
jgi:hypothetical protein